MQIRPMSKAEITRVVIKVLETLALDAIVTFPFLKIFGSIHIFSGVHSTYTPCNEHPILKQVIKINV